MKKKLLILLFIVGAQVLPVNGQSQIVSEFSEAVTDLTGSFMDNPYHHDNTVKVNEFATKFKSNTKELIDLAPYGSTDFSMLLNIQKILNSLEHITDGVLQRYPGGVSARDFEFFGTVFDAFGWTKSVISSTQDLILYEYRKDNFKMVLAKNLRPKLEGGDYNAVSYQCYSKDVFTKKDEIFTGRCVFGGDYQFVLCCDDKTKYTKITKVTSQRGFGR